jgi:hypothetical protein
VLRKLGYFFLIIITLGGIVTTWWLFEYWPSSSNRFRFEITFEIDGKLISGNVVQGLTVSGGPFLPSAGSNIGYRARGQALLLDLPEIGTAFVTMQMYCKDGSVRNWCGSTGVLVSKACGLERIPGEDYRSYVRKYRHLSGECDVPQSLLPVIVRFLDESEQESARVVALDASGRIEGTNIRFLRAKIKFTNALLNTGLEKRLPWLVEPQTYFPTTIKTEDGSTVPYFPYLSFQR